jgi:hypothetical protein
MQIPSGLLCHLIGADAQRLAQDGTIAGMSPGAESRAGRP